MVIKVDKSEEFKKSGKKLISEYEGAKWKEELLWDENESNKSNSSTTKQKKFRRRILDRIRNRRSKNRNENRVARKRKRRFFIL